MRCEQNRDNHIAQLLGALGGLPHRPSDGLHNVHATLTRAGEGDDADRRQIDALCKTAGVRHQSRLWLSEAREDLLPVRDTLVAVDVIDDEPVEVLPDAPWSRTGECLRVRDAAVEGDDFARTCFRDG